MLPGSPIELQPEGPPLRRQRRAFWIGSSLLVAGALAVVAVAVAGGDEDEDGGGRETTDTALLSRAVERTRSLDGFVMVAHQKVESFEVDVRIEVDGDVALMQIEGLPLGDTMVVDGVQLRFEDGRWREHPPYGATGGDLNDDLAIVMTDLQVAQAVEAERNDTTVTYDVPCVASDPTSVLGTICERDGAQVRVTVDIATSTVVGVRYEGRIPVRGGVWEDGFFELAITDEAPSDLEAPSDVDRSGVECLAEHLELSEVTSAAVSTATEGMTTDELSVLYTEWCDFVSWPPGADFGNR